MDIAVNPEVPSPSSGENPSPQRIIEESVIEASFSDSDPGNYTVKKIIKKKIKKRKRKGDGEQTLRIKRTKHEYEV